MSFLKRMKGCRLYKEYILAGLVIAMCAAIPAYGQELLKISQEEAVAITTDAYIYGYPLVTMEITRRVMTNVAIARGNYAPGEFAKMRTYPSPSDKEVTAPNADTLYTLAWLDVSQEPYILTLPDAGDRYYLMPMLSGWTDVFQAPGKRTTGTRAQKYAITGPGWNSTLPEGVTHYRSPTSMAWILGRIYCTGTPEDYKAVHAMQDHISLVPLSAYGGAPYTPPAGKLDPTIDTKTPVRVQVNRMDARSYFTLLAALMKHNPPAKEDAPIVGKMAKIGIVPGKGFDAGKLDPAVIKALEGVPEEAQKKIMAGFTDFAAVNGWRYSTKLGVYGTAYLKRALAAAILLGANKPEDAIYQTSQTDKDGKLYNGANNYVLHFDKGQMPPVNAFWSLTMYDGEFFFVPNPLNRYTLSSRNTFTLNPDGSVDLYIQNQSPGKGKETNWLPAPTGKFILMLRFYWPKQAIIDGSWKPPAVVRGEAR
jgi:hypothetical protein